MMCNFEKVRRLINTYQLLPQILQYHVMLPVCQPFAYLSTSGFLICHHAIVFFHDIYESHVFEN